MQHFDHRLFGKEMGMLVRECVERALTPIGARLEALETAVNAKPARSEDDVVVLQLRRRIDDIAEDVRALAAIPSAPAGKPGEKGEPGKDGVNLAGMLIDRAGELIATLSNGEQRNLGRVVGKDGERGQDGRDGMGFDDMTVEYDGERTLTQVYTKGDRTSRVPVKFPVMLHRGVYKPGEPYEAGDAVQFDGGMFVAKRDTDTRPPSDDWTLCVRRGRDGKNGKDGAEGLQGKEGPPGRDLTQMDFAGRKW